MKKIFWPFAYVIEVLSSKGRTGHFEFKKSAKRAWQQL